MRVALTGGIACGKSLFAKFLAELGVRFLDADDVVHDLEAAGGGAVPAIRARFGDSVIASSGAVDRAALARIVFSDSASRSALESILFPLVRARLQAFVSDRSSDCPIEIGQCSNRFEIGNCKSRIENPSLRLAIIPLLFESHWETDYDIILCIASPREQQIARMVETRGYSLREAEARLAAQTPVAEKMARADYIIKNDSTPEDLKRQASCAIAWVKARMEEDHGRRNHAC